MALDTLDLSVLAVVAILLAAYFTRGTLWGNSDDGVTVARGSSRDLIEVISANEKKALVLFGSQTGTSEDYSHKFAKEFQSRFSIPTMCGDLADYDYENLNEIFTSVDGFQLIVFLMATYGEGEPPDNAVEFFDYLENECEDLSTVKFSCFGLGNSTYEFYNAMGKRTVSTLTEKGATLIGELGLGDDGRGTMDEDYMAWKDGLFDVLKDKLSLKEHDLVYEPGIKVEESSLTVLSPEVSLGEPDSKYVNPSEDDLKSHKLGPFDHTHPYLAPITASKELFNSETRHCVHAEFDLSDSNLKYSTGDHLAIWPSNSNEEVAKLLDILGLSDKKDIVIKISSLDPTVHPHVSSPSTYESVIRHYLEISGPVSRQFVGSVAQFAPTEEAKALASKLGKDKELFHKEVTAKYLNISDLLHVLSNGAKWTTVPFEFVIESIAHLQPRYYSISSSSMSEKQTVHVTAVVEQERYPNVDKVVTGVATNLLLNIQQAQNKVSDSKLPVTYDLAGPRNKFEKFKLPVHVRRSTFKLPSNPATPIICIGPGTGVAPFRGFIREKVKQVENGSNVGKAVLFFGCRNSNEDFLYKDEWVDYSKKLGDKFELVTAFSRETAKKVYVQDKMLEKASEINQALNDGAFFYVCGDAARMARDVQSVLIKIFVAERKVTEEVATDMVKNLRVLNRYQEDVW
ncbi:hypothetical protein OGAPHI_001800 [Ogataea philodendri]|uniref:NADPH--cytochrome P450 reductase n=2 Tax=Saccharomycotina TaxID=147537 RepID=A0A9P8T7J6_9ASCO|nr:uncharacterized protein OGAPHI_001800 [Ogataea philodendri]KAH3668046.1 hypothetical protein OGAPHI_001800 [Ogataea philodendri]